MTRERTVEEQRARRIVVDLVRDTVRAARTRGGGSCLPYSDWLFGACLIAGPVLGRSADVEQRVERRVRRWRAARERPVSDVRAAPARR